MVPALLQEVLEVEGMTFGVNYGCNRLRFPAPVKVGSRIRLGAEVASVEDLEGGAQVVLDVTIESEGLQKPNCVAQLVYRYYS